MLPEELNLILQKYKRKVFVYTWEYFTRRIHNELIYSIQEESPFFYVEIKFDVVYKELPSIEDRSLFWKVFFELLSTQKRGCDLCGFLKDNEGIALLFVDSFLNTKDSNPPWYRFCNEVKAGTFFNMRKWDGIIYAEYPPRQFFTRQ